MTEEMKEEYQVCYKHPDRKTYLRCNKCGRPICLDCAVQTPTGYRCKDCIKEQQKVFDTSEKQDYIIGALIAAAAGYIGALADQALAFLPAFLTALIFGWLFGTLICTAVRKAVKGRRSAALTNVVTAAAAVGALIQRRTFLGFFLSMLASGGPGTAISSLMSIVMQLLFIVVLCAAIRMNMNGMVFRR